MKVFDLLNDGRIAVVEMNPAYNDIRVSLGRSFKAILSYPGGPQGWPRQYKLVSSDFTSALEFLKPAIDIGIIEMTEDFILIVPNEDTLVWMKVIL
jgi:hypothetical protein